MARTTDRSGLYDVVAVNIKTGAKRLMASGQPYEIADAIVKMAVMRRGVEEEFFKAVESAQSDDAVGQRSE